MYKLESKLYYKINLPLINSYKDFPRDYFPDYYEMLALISKQKPQSCAETFEDLKSKFTFDKINQDWFEQNADKLCHMQNLIKKIKSYSNFALYSDAIIFNNGVSSNLLQFYIDFAHKVSEISSFILDMREDFFFDVTKTFDSYNLFCKHIPATFSAWPDVLKSKDISDAEKEEFSDKACLLFEFILYRAAFAYWNCRYVDRDFKQALKHSILCHYKWLKGKKIFLPKELQEKVSKFPYVY